MNSEEHEVIRNMVRTFLRSDPKWPQIRKRIVARIADLTRWPYTSDQLMMVLNGEADFDHEIYLALTEELRRAGHKPPGDDDD